MKDNQMTKLSINIAAIELAAQKVDFTVDPTEFSAIALEAIFVYGVRRWFQDSINSSAHTFKEAKAEAKAIGAEFNGGKPFDVQAAFQARLDAAKSGILSAPRSKSGLAGLTAYDETVYAIAVEMKTAPAFKPLLLAWNKSKGLGTLERKTAILEAVETLAETPRAALRKAASDRLALAESLSGIAE